MLYYGGLSHFRSALAVVVTVAQFPEHPENIHPFACVLHQNNLKLALTDLS